MITLKLNRSEQALMLELLRSKIWDSDTKNATNAKLFYKIDGAVLGAPAAAPGFDRIRADDITPGKWEVAHHGTTPGNTSVEVQTTTGLPVAVMSHCGRAEQNANAVAALPELLQRAREFQSYLELKLEGFRREYPAGHCIITTAEHYLSQVRHTLAKSKGRA
ncbi:MAG: hypothetical protein ACOYD4_04155 [Solirubrobacterales bacterium]